MNTKSIDLICGENGVSPKLGEAEASRSVGFSFAEAKASASRSGCENKFDGFNLEFAKPRESDASASV